MRKVRFYLLSDFPFLLLPRQCLPLAGIPIVNGNCKVGIRRLGSLSKHCLTASGLLFVPLTIYVIGRYIGHGWLSLTQAGIFVITVIRSNSKFRTGTCGKAWYGCQRTFNVRVNPSLRRLLFLGQCPPMIYSIVMVDDQGYYSKR